MNTLFIRNPIVGLRLLLAVILSIVLMTLDHQYRTLESVRKVLTVVVLPLQVLVDVPVRMVNWLDLSISTHQSLLNENTELRGQLLLFKSQVQRYEALEQENTQLRELLQSSTRVEGKVEVVQLLSVSSAPFIHQMTLDKGSNSKVYIGQPVLDAHGIMGQVIRVTPFTSEVLLITDTRSAIPVQDSRNNLRAIATGSGSYGLLQLLHVPKTADIQEGDPLVTSGLDQRFPPGYPVGVVTKVYSDPAEHFTSIEVTPSARLNRSRLVLLLWPHEKTSKLNIKNNLALQTQRQS